MNQKRSILGMKIYYELQESNWAEGTIKLGSKEATFGISGYRDPLGDFSGQILYLIERFGKKKDVYDFSNNNILLEKDNVAEVTWSEDTRGHRWFLELNDDLNISVRFETYKDYYYPETIIDKKTLQYTLPLVDFLEAVVRMMDEVLNKYGFIGYKHFWGDFEFPISNYLRLKNILETKRVEKLAAGLEQRTQETSSPVSGLKQELQILNKMTQEIDMQEENFDEE